MSTHNRRKAGPQGLGTLQQAPVFLVAEHERLTASASNLLREWGVDPDAASSLAGRWIAGAEAWELAQPPPAGTDSEFQALLATSHVAVSINGLRTAGAALYVLRHGERSSAEDLLGTLLMAQGLLGFAHGSTARSTLDQISKHLGWARDDAEAELSTQQALRDMSEENKELQERGRLAEAGRRGAAAKNARVIRLKAWAVEQSAAMRGADIEIARKLVLRLPAELVDASVNPERRIYEAIREARRRSK